MSEQTPKSGKYIFTVFTATYNRAYSLHRVYDSLKAQTYRDFEWLIVDDGSQDDTQALVKQWQSAANFPIRYLWQQNAGKPKAFNHGVSEAEGELFLNLDSDDACVPHALERFKYHWDSIPVDQKLKFSGVTCLIQDVEGNLLGSRFPRDPLDSDALEIRLKYKIRGADRWGFHRTEILKQFPFPELEGQKHVPMSTVWDRIATKYKTRFVNDILKIHYFSPEPDKLSSTLTRVKSPKGAQFYYKEFVNLDYPIPMPELLRGYVNFVRYSFHSGIGIAAQVRDIRSAALWFAALPVGFVAYLSDRRNIGHTTKGKT